jgi:UDPglucose--hexose-1-phosphate uridylyltransferase
VCYSPRHDLSLATLPVEAIRGVVDLWAEETTRLASLDFVGHVQVFENRGAAMGASNPHPHGQVWASSHVPTLAARRIEGQRRHFARAGRDLLGEYAQQELRAGERIVCRHEDWLAVVPFWAVWPFEVLLIPVPRRDRLSALPASERDGLARILRELHGRFDRLFATPFPYSMAWHQAPRGANDPALRLHASYFPPLLRSATVRKFLVGYELAGEAQRDLTPEAAAERLRSVRVAP